MKTPHASYEILEKNYKSPHNLTLILPNELKKLSLHHQQN